MTADAAEAWQQWHERRIETVSAPHGPLSLVGTHRIEFPRVAAPDAEGRTMPAGARELRQDT
ncbi:hypothetical protein AB0945_10995 [Streptomyces sp. NPDC005474]|uniref:hypothetical protein n=1 Tax=Streptomyces sp. NPDC005474 TaxID=3154878 RepID=UPI0034553704